MIQTSQIVILGAAILGLTACGADVSKSDSPEIYFSSSIPVVSKGEVAFVDETDRYSVVISE